MKRKILFITGTRADYGKLKPLLQAVEQSDNFELYVYVTGMHLLTKYGSTYQEVLKDGYKNIHIAFDASYTDSMSYNLGEVICDFTEYVKIVKPSLILVHGDRMESLGAAAVGALSNIRVAHIEGGEVSGTIDESLRHAISKLANVHFVANTTAKDRLLQLGEQEKHIFIIGSPDIDIMLSESLPSLEDVYRRYDLHFDTFGILLYHPVTTEYAKAERNAKIVVDAVLASPYNYIVIYPNNDLGSKEIIVAYDKFKGKANIKMFPSLRFECFLTLLKNAIFIMGNSSAGIREASVFGVPAIDIGTRQKGRGTSTNKNVVHTVEDKNDILTCMLQISDHRYQSMEFGSGNSTEKFMKTINEKVFWESTLQKKFVDWPK